MFDFHTHTFLSDGVLSPIELVRRAIKCGYRVMAITDHVGPGNMEFVLKTLIADCEMVNSAGISSRFRESRLRTLRARTSNAWRGSADGLGRRL